MGAKKGNGNAIGNKGGGRKTLFHFSFVDIAYKYCLLGATDKQLGENFGVSESTINAWKLKFPEFSEALKKGKSVADAHVAEKLFKRAVGYEVVEIKKEYADENKDIVLKITETKKIVLPDTTAQIFWLKNRQKEYWRDSSSIDYTQKTKEVFENREDRDKRIRELIKQYNGN